LKFWKTKAMLRELAYLHAAGARRIDAADEIEKGGLPAAGGSDDHGEALPRYIEAHAMDRGDLQAIVVVGLDDFAEAHDWFTGFFLHLASSCIGTNRYR
jgi:hypothetical protein